MTKLSISEARAEAATVVLKLLLKTLKGKERRALERAARKAWTSA